MQAPPAIAAASDKITEYACSRSRPAATCGHSTYSPYPQNARTMASSPTRSHGLPAMRVSRVSTRTEYLFCHII